MAMPIKIPINSNLILLSKVLPLNQYSLLSSLQVNIVYAGSNNCLINNQKNSFQTPPSSTPGSCKNFIFKGFLKFMSSLTKELSVSKIIQFLSISKNKKAKFAFRFEAKGFSSKFLISSLSISPFIFSLESRNRISLLL